MGLKAWRPNQHWTCNPQTPKPKAHTPLALVASLDQEDLSKA